MFERSSPVTYAELDAAEAELRRLERTIARARARQIEILEWLDGVKVARIHGARSMQEWTAAHIDVAPTTARDLVMAARAPEDERVRTTKEESFDRTIATLQLVAAGGTAEDVAASRRRDLAGVRRLTAKLERITRIEEQELVRRRHLTIEPTLDHTAWRLAGLVPALDGQVIAEALAMRAERFPQPPAGEREGRGARMIDALTALAHDYLDSPTMSGIGTGPGGGKVTLFVDHAGVAEASGAPVGVIAGGPRVGPAAIERILCGGSAALVAVDGFRPIAATDSTRQIPPAIRKAVLHRDEGCTIDGCRSRYRLEPHHIIPRRNGGNNDVSNLTTLCWYHHHVAVHGYGKRLDPESPPLRRRFLTPARQRPP